MTQPVRRRTVDLDTTTTSRILHSAADLSPVPDFTRRSFLAACAVGLGGRAFPRVAPALRGNPHLTARPGTPTLDAEIGITRIAPELERGALLYVPASYRSDTPAPLMVALHGGSGYAGSWSRLYDVCEERGVVLMAPDSRGYSWDRVAGDFGPDVAFIDAALRFTFDRCAIDPGHVALAGFSDGASYALSLGPCNGDLFTHLIAWSPGFSDPADPIVGSPRVFISHGSSDRVLPVVATRSGLVPMFEMDGYDIEYMEFEGDHEMPPAVVTRAMDWFLG